MYNFILNMWVFRSEDEVSESDIQRTVDKGYITQEEANQILATPKQV